MSKPITESDILRLRQSCHICRDTYEAALWGDTEALETCRRAMAERAHRRFVEESTP